MLYFVGQQLGAALTPDINRLVDGIYEGKLDTVGRRFLSGANVSMSKSNNNKVKTKKEEKVNVMSSGKEDTSEKPGFLEMLKSDGKQAAFRVASTQISLGIKKGLVTAMESKGASNERIMALKEMLDTKYGEAFVNMIAGLGCEYVPGINKDERVKKLGAEFRVNGMSIVGNELFSMLTDHLLPVIQGALANIPAETETTASKKRVLDSTPAEEQETETKNEKTLTA